MYDSFSPLPSFFPPSPFSSSTSPSFPESHVLFAVSWNKVERQRNLFKNYAKQQGFDHLNPDIWYRHREKVLSAKVHFSLSSLPLHRLSSSPFCLLLYLFLIFQGAANAIQHHQYSLANTLVHLFPDIGLDKSKLRNGRMWLSLLSSVLFLFLSAFDAYIFNSILQRCGQIEIQGRGSSSTMQQPMVSIHATQIPGIRNQKSEYVPRRYLSLSLLTLIILSFFPSLSLPLPLPLPLPLSLSPSPPLPLPLSPSPPLPLLLYFPPS